MGQWDILRFHTWIKLLKKRSDVFLFATKATKEDLSFATRLCWNITQKAQDIPPNIFTLPAGQIDSSIFDFLATSANQKKESCTTWYV